MAIFLFLSFAELFPGPYELSLPGVKQQNNVEMVVTTFFFTKLKTKLFFSISLRKEATKPLDGAWVLWMHHSISTYLLSNSPDAWDGAILFSNVFIHGSDILNNLCLPAEL